MNHDNDYHETINYGNKFPEGWYYTRPEDSLLDVKQDEKDKQYCYKPYRTIHNY